MILKKIWSRFCGKKSMYRFWYRIHRVAMHGMNIGMGEDYNTSGEKWILSYIRENIHKSEAVIFDVGANVGGYTRELLRVFEHVKIHAFEPSKITYETYCKNVQSDRVAANNFGLSDIETDAVLFSDKSNSGLASIFERQLDYLGIDMDNREIIHLSTIDAYCSRNHIKEIDFLKLDVEGNELNVLNGGKEILSQGKIRYIQFEFGGCNIDSRTYFKDFWNLLHDNYHIFLVMKNGLQEIIHYTEEMEIFVTTNYFCVKKVLGNC